MLKQVVLIIVSLAMLTTLGRLDDGSRSLADVYQLQNLPALVGYGFLFYTMLLLVFGGVMAMIRSISRSS